MNTALKKATLLIAMMAILSGCAAVKDFLAPLGSALEPQPEEVVRTPIEEKLRLDPIGRNYFELESADQDVIGEVQVVFTSEENTFSDLARE